MNKNEFLELLRKRLSSISVVDREKAIQYYEESIDDRMEDGLSEKEAVRSMGDLDEIVENIVCDKSFLSLVKTKVSSIKNNTKSNAWILFVILGFPLWFPLLMAAGSIILSVYLVIIVLVFSLYIILGAFAVSCVGGIIAGLFKMQENGYAVGLCVIGMGLMLGALSIILIEPCKKGTKGLISITNKIFRKIKRIFIPKRED